MALTPTAELALAGFGMAGPRTRKDKTVEAGKRHSGRRVGEGGGTKICDLVGVTHSRITSPAPGKLAIYIGVGRKESFAPADGESWLGVSGVHSAAGVCVYVSGVREI